MDLVKEFKAARSRSTPLLAITTSNQPSTTATLAEASPEHPVIAWDIVRGMHGINDPGAEVIRKICQGDTPQEATGDPKTALEVAAKFPARALLIMTNAHRFVDDAPVATAIGNLREPYKGIAATLVMLGPFMRLPAELTTDVIILKDPLPDDAALRKIVEFTYQEVKDSAAELTPLLADQAVQALRGLSSFGAEQQAFLSLRRDDSGKLGLDMVSLWERKMEAINALPGLTMEYKKTAPGGIQGLKALREMLDRLFRESNPERPGAVLHIDEIDKALAGFGAGGGAGDSTGVTQDQVGQILQYMEDRSWDGMIPVGPPGTGKSLVSRSAAGLYSVPYVRLDLGALKGSLVGQSEERIREALETIDRIAAGRVFVMATCNRMDSLPPELRRRFTAGIWYFDLPDAADRADLWRLYSAKYGLPLVGDDKTWADGWTGAEIRNVCRSAWRLGITIDEAREYIVPICESGADELARLRGFANGRFLDASKGGKFGIRVTGPTSLSNKRAVEA